MPFITLLLKIYISLKNINNNSIFDLNNSNKKSKLGDIVLPND